MGTNNQRSKPTGISVTNVASRLVGAGLLWSVIAPVDSGTIEVGASAAAEADVTPLGVFLS